MKRICKSMLAVTMAMVTVLPTMTYAATHDVIEDVSSDTATVTLGKVLTVNQSGKFPNLQDFNFEIEAIKGWDNANASASGHGNDISASVMPMPTGSNTQHHKITVDGSKATVSVGDFTTSQSTTDVADTNKEKLRTTDMNIKFSRAGYYLYRITEKYDASAKVPGVAYDDNNYYVVVYVCNKTDELGNTVEGVYVHDITSFRNDPDTDVQPDLSDIANVTDNGGVNAIENTYENFAKVGKSERTPGTDSETGLPTGPNKLEAYRFWNDQTTHDIVITNNVTGNLGDLTKEFEFEVKISGLEKNKTYSTDVDAEEKTDKNHTSQSVEMIAGSKGTVNSDNMTFTSDENGDAIFTVKLTDDEIFVMNAIPGAATYQVTEAASDHIASYEVLTTREDSAVIENVEAANTMDNTSLATAVEVVDGVSNVDGRINNEDNDGTITVAFNNHRNLATITGVPYYGNGIFMFGLFAILSMLIAFALWKYDERSFEDYE